MSDIQFPHQELTREIIGAAIAVHQELRPGLDEKLYERALCIELAERGIHFAQQPEYPVSYRNHFLGNLRPDLVVENKIIVDAKCVDSFSAAHEAQMLAYLSVTGLPIALLLNFKVWPLGKKRIVHTLPKPQRPQ
ncbi:MAG: GxxExxY protein [Verrucomicrobiales bacterium VVV1]|nr:MAG: GxxExxY protein [Verrucomicrobiales bacterium VVV1]